MSNQLKEAIADLRERVLYLKELGVGSLSVSPEAGVIGERPMHEPRMKGSVPVVEGFKSEIADVKAHEPAGSRLSALPSLKERRPSKFFDKFNPREEERRPGVGESSQVSACDAAGKIDVVAVRADATETIAEIHAEIGPDCTRCKLSQLGRTQVVNSVGNAHAQLMFCGEAPGADEDRLGEPFVGRAGQLLTDIIEKGLEIPRKDVFIGNINRCRPPGNRAPEADECSVCKPFLLREIAVVRPKVIVVLGATAAQNLLETKTPIGKLRGKFHDYLGSKVMPTFHPAYLLRDPNKKREVWEDMKLVKEYLRNR